MQCYCRAYAWVPNIYSDRYFVATKLYTGLCAERHTHRKTQGSFKVEKLQLKQTAEREIWDRISSSLPAGANEKMGPWKGERKNWYVEDCRDTPFCNRPLHVQVKIDTENWREKGHMCRYEQKKAEMQEYEEIEKLPEIMLKIFRKRYGDSKKVSRLQRTLVGPREMIWRLMLRVYRIFGGNTSCYLRLNKQLKSKVFSLLTNGKLH